MARKAKGEKFRALWPDVNTNLSTGKLQAMKDGMSQREWQSLYLNDPLPTERTMPAHPHGTGLGNAISMKGWYGFPNHR